MPPLPAFFLLLLLLAGFVPPAAAQSTPTVSLQPSGMLTMMEHAVPTELYFDGLEYDGLGGARGIAVSGDLLFVTGEGDDALSVWRVNAEAGTLSQTAIYQDSDTPQMNSNYIAVVDGRVDGLGGARSIAVSGDGKLLFVAASFDHALSVWRVNAEAGTLMQNRVYRMGGTNGLFGVAGIVVSDDLLFVTADSDDALGVWRINTEAATLSQTAIYQDSDIDEDLRINEANGRFDGLNGAGGIAVSGDGALLFVTASINNALSVWRVNAEAGTLSQTAVYQDSEVDEMNLVHIREVDGRVDGLRGLMDLTISGELLFVTAFRDDALSVWRVNAEAGTLSQTTLYQDPEVFPGSRQYIAKVDGRVDGLNGARDAAVSGDGALLFVTAINELSVWRVNAEAGTLSQTALYRNGENRIDGLFGATGATVSGDDDLLFVAGEFNDALSVWQINNAEVPFGVPVIIRVQSDMAVVQEVTVTVTARNGAGPVAAQTVTLSSDMLSDDAIFPAGTLGPGRQIFTAQAQPPALDTSAARIAVQVLPALLSLEAQQEPLAFGSTVALTVQTIAGLPATASFTIDAINIAAAEKSTATITVEYPAGTTEQEVAFPAQQIASLGSGQLEFSIRLPDNSPFRVGDGSTATVQIVTPQLGLQRGQPLTAGSTVILTVQPEIELHAAINYTVMALHTVSATTTSVLTIHPAGTTEHSVSFSGQQIASPGQWEFSILPAELLFESMPITVTISLDFIQPQGTINADDLVFALRYLVRCGGSAEGCQANGEDLSSLARNLGNALQIEQLPAALQFPDASSGGEERPAANWFTLLLGLQGLPVELLFPDSEQEPRQLENAIRSMLSVQEQEE